MSMTTIGLNALNAYQQALNITSQNIANANTANYAREVVTFADTGTTTGVAADIKRISNDTLNQAAYSTTSTYNQANTFSTQLTNIQSLFDSSNTANGGTSIGVNITNALNALNQLNANPTNSSSRSLFLTSLSSLSNSVQSINNSITQQQTSTNQLLSTDISQANQILQSLASLNTQISAAPNNSTLLNQRDGLLQQLSNYMNFNVSTAGDGSAALSLTNGLTLVSGSNATPLVTMNDPNNPTNSLPAVQTSNGAVSISNFVQGGQIAGLVQYQQTVLAPTSQQLGMLSLGIAQAFNSQNKLGMTQSGTLGGNLFQDINTTAAMNGRVIANTNNTGNAQIGVSITNVGNVTGSNYSLSMGASNSYVLTRASDNTVIASGTLSGTTPQQINVPSEGFNFTINSGTPANGDVYQISPTAGAAANLSLTSMNPSVLALASPVTASVGAQSATSTGSISVTGVNDTSNSAFSTPGQLNPPITIQFLSSNTYQIVDSNNPSNVLDAGPLTYTPGANVFPTAGGYDPGYQIQLSGTMNAGDTFNVSYSTNTSDNSNGLAMSQLFQQPIYQSGDNFSSAYQSIANTLSTQSSVAQMNVVTTQALQTQATNNVQSNSGVNLVEESLNLSQYQQSYQAAAQVLTIARQVLQTILSIATG